MQPDTLSANHFPPVINMLRIILSAAALTLLAACSDSQENETAAASVPPPAPVKNLCEIDGNSIGGIPLGTTLAQVRQSFPNAVLTPVNDAESTEFMSVKLNADVVVFAYADGEGDDSGRISENRPITYLETGSPACKTAHGVHAGMLLKIAEQSYGVVEQIVLSEIEARQTAEFANQPATLSFRIDDSGSFDDADTDLPKISTEYRDDAKIQSIAVFGLPEDVAEAQ